MRWKGAFGSVAAAAALVTSALAAAGTFEQLALVTLPSGAAVKEPEMVDLPGGSFTMGSNEEASEKPPHKVTVAPFSMAKYPITVGQWRQCVDSRLCTYSPSGAESDDAPIHNVSWSDAQQYVSWLAKATNKNYRLPTEAEFEYAARAGTETRFAWGPALKDGLANCKGCGTPYDPKAPLKAGSFPANAFGLFDMAGGVEQWVADCWHKSYEGAPADGSAWGGGEDCDSHVLRGGSWLSDPKAIRPAARNKYDTAVRYPSHGFRVVRSE
jgi:formylglycine-generating enzyme required for sulfatase activity